MALNLVQDLVHPGLPVQDMLNVDISSSRVFFIEDLPLLHNYLSSSGTGPSKPARYLLASILTVSPESLKVD